jgi:hypothetical protein
LSLGVFRSCGRSGKPWTAEVCRGDPQYHRIHHSLEERHWNKNFAERLPIWDFLFGTLYAGFDEYPQVGIPDYPVRETSRRPLVVTSLWIALILYPFQKLGQELRRFSGNFRDAEYGED